MRACIVFESRCGSTAEVGPSLATFDTGLAKVRRLPGSAAGAATRELHRHHHAVVVDQESLYVEDTSGPLLEGALERAASCGRRLGARPARAGRR